MIYEYWGKRKEDGEKKKSWVQVWSNRMFVKYRT